MNYRKKIAILLMTLTVCSSPLFSLTVPTTFAVNGDERIETAEGCGITADSQTPIESSDSSALDVGSESSSSEISSDSSISSSDSTNPIVEEKEEVASEEQISSEIPPVKPAPKLIELGTSELTAEYNVGACGQGIGHIAYEYKPLLSLDFNDAPVIVLQLPNEIASQLNNSPANQATFLNNLTGEVTLPSGILGNQVVKLPNTTSLFTITYNAQNSAILVSFPKTAITLSLLNKWKADFKFDTAVLYKNGITIPPAANGSSYPVKGDFNSGLSGIISVATVNSKSGAIPSATMSLGTCPVLKIDAPSLTSPVLNNQTQITGKYAQAQNTGYTYTANLSIQRVDGTAAPPVVANIPIGSDGSFSTTLPSAVEYLDTMTATVTAKSKTTADFYQSLPSSVVSASWPLVSPTLTQVNAGATAITGSAVQTTGGTYKAHLQINGNASREQIINLPANGQYSFAVTPSIRGGDKVSVSIQGYSARTGNLLVETPLVNQTVSFTPPSLLITQVIERRNSQGTWEVAPSVVTGQTIRYTSTVTLTNANAIWNQQLLQDWIPSGLLNLSNAQVTKKNVDGSLVALGTPLLVANPASPSLQAWNYQNLLSANNLTQANEALVLQYTAVVSDSALNQSLVHSIFADGMNGGGQNIPQQSANLTTPVGSGTLRFIQVPTTIEFKNIKIPTKQTVYNRTNTPNALTVADGRISKSQWHLSVREAQPLTSATNQVLAGAFVYSQNGVDKPVSAASIEIMSYLSPNDNNVSVNWQANEGIRLNLAPNVNLNVNQHYQGSLEWILSDAPL